MINELAKEIHENAKSKGFYDEDKNIGEMLALIHSEVSEALEADRKGIYAIDKCNDVSVNIDLFASKNRMTNNFFQRDFQELVKDTFEDELADVVIRVFDLCAYRGINIESHIKAKMRYNSLREHKHGKRY